MSTGRRGPSRDLFLLRELPKIIEIFSDRLMFFNTLENDGTGPPGNDNRFANRIRYTTHFNEATPVSNDAFRLDTAGSFDLPNRESIQSVAKIKDVLLVFCERSIFRISATGNGLNPFIYEELNSELGVESVNSPIEFDRSVIGFGASGIHASNG